MSYILNALKHSESLRTRSDVPHIDTQQEFVELHQQRMEGRHWKGLALLVAGALLASLAAWLLRSPPDEPVVPASVPMAPVAKEAPPSAPTAVIDEPAPPAEAAPGVSTLQGMAGVRIQVEDEETQAAPLALELPVRAGRVPAAVAAPAQRQVAPPVAVSPPADAVEPPADELGDAQHWKKLPSAIQKQLRDMAFNAHVYSANPSSRFIRVSGRTLHEGDALNAELRLQQITRDGLVFTYRNGRYWLRLN